jgi:DNA-binding CsgD family transcriptional regulator
MMPTASGGPVTSTDEPRHEVEALFRDPVERLQRILERGEQQLEARRSDLAEVRYALYELTSSGTLGRDRAARAVEPLPAELAPPVVRHLVDHTTTIVRHCTMTVDVGSGLDPDVNRRTRELLGAGVFRQQTIYPIDIMETKTGRAWVRAWADAGEQQRLSLVPPTDFVVFDQDAVVASAVWGDPAADYVLIRDPMLVAAFTALFDRSFLRALPMAPEGAPDPAEGQLMRLLALGLKDESIARYLGCSLRTVRRRVAQLMERHGVQTRFQLGVAATRAGLATLVDDTDR